MENIFNFISTLFMKIDLGWVFLVGLFIIISLSVVNVLLTLRAKNYTLKIKRGLMLIGVSTIFMQAFFYANLSQNQALTFFNIAVFFLGLSVPCFIKKRVKREIIVTNEQKTFIKETQKKIQEDGLFDKEEISKTTPEKSLLFSFEDVLQPEEKSVKKVKVEQTKKVEKERGFDYSNVKTAIEKTLKKDLLPEEKRKIVGLEIAILQSERGEDNMAIKEEVNEGLSSLLKIMSRYSV